MDLPVPAGAPALLPRLLGAGSWFGRRLADAWDVPLRSYLRSLIPPERPPSTAGPWLSLLAEAVARDADGGPEAADALLRHPVIQQSDHANLLLDRETFLNNVLFHRAAADAGLPVAINSQCTTVVCLSRRVPPTGPVFLAVAGGRYDVFGRSRNEYRRSNFCGLRGPVEIVMRPTGPTVLPPSLAERFVGRVFPDAPTAYRVLNSELWSGFGTDPGVRRVQLDEATTAEALALHVEHPGSPVRRLLFDPAVRSAFLAVKRQVVASPDNLVVNRAAPDWFWLRRGSRLVAVVRTDDGYVTEHDGSPAPLDLEDPTVVAAALRAGDLHGDRVLAYLVRSMLPGAVAVGGSVQQDYTAAYRTMLAKTQEVTPFLDAEELATVLDPGLSRLGGAPLLEPPPAEHAAWDRLGVGADPAGLVAPWLERTVGEAVGGLDCAWFYDGNLRAAERRRVTEGANA
ncbi:hypothetical protein C5F59_033650 [Streptomyces sp. QL37]|uniref:hypothetical protein n=1 Tax=Streptomyces sp. QL37 TaxID=2093747 RepID=UPI000CF25238|nr:hypothetical protein [Streptomyces sp. QL37]PPQ61159.1 hypothetical protein C5F59_34150 [Streptomyces sp. QL37]